ncbi:hypothetical protein DSD19_15765 [Rhodovulum sp. BSW8]|nr:hypothetical protein DSD19_15765 [Rhodovulum sp. BSW8]
MEASDAKRLREFEAEDAKLKRSEPLSAIGPRTMAGVSTNSGPSAGSERPSSGMPNVKLFW